MKKLAISLLILVIFSACQKQDATDKRIVGEWTIETVKKEKGSWSIGFNDISNEVDYEHIHFKADNSVLLITKNDTHQGSWDLIHENQPVYYHNNSQNSTYNNNYRMKLELRWQEEFDYLDNTYINVLRKNKLKLVSEQDPKDVVIVCGR